MNVEKGKELLAEFRGQPEPDDWELGTGELGSENSKALAKMLKERIALEKKGITGDVPRSGPTRSVTDDQIAELKQKQKEMLANYHIDEGGQDMLN